MTEPPMSEGEYLVAWRYRILDEIREERERVEEHIRSGAKGWLSMTAADTGTGYRLAVLGEEHGEVCKEVLEMITGERSDINAVRRELVHLAATSVAWIEGIDAGWRP